MMPAVGCTGNLGSKFCKRPWIAAKRIEDISEDSPPTPLLLCHSLRLLV